MKISINWLKEHLPFTQSLEEIVDALIFSGVEIEGIEHRGVDFSEVVVAQIDSFEQHPNADRLSVCRVNDGSGIARQIVCGAKNFKAGDKVPLALPGASLPGGFKIKVSKLRGVESEGMLCSAKELNLADDAAGLLILDPSAEVGAPLSKLFPSDTIIDTEATPNRPDLLSYFGIARELAALLNLPAPSYLQPKTSGERTTQDANGVELRAPDACPFYTVKAIRGVKVGPSPNWLKQRLEASGLRSINNVVDVTNYILLDLGQPLHAFDLAKVSGGIRIRYAEADEKVLALDGKEYALRGDDLLIADHVRPLAIAGVMGGEGSGVTIATVDLLLESAYFAPAAVRKTSRRLGLISDSSFRFERGIDPESVILASRRATDLVLEVAGGTAEDILVTAGEVPQLRHIVEMRQERCEALLGMPVPNAADLLKRLGLKSIGINRWETPSYRSDLEREVDLIEEVCRLAGIQKIPSTVVSVATPASGPDREHDVQMRLRQRFAGLGLFEARNLKLVDEQSLDCSLDPKSEVLRLRNPLVAEQETLRPSLLGGLVKAAERNFSRGAASIALFEIGTVFRSGAEEERVNVALILSGERQTKTWNQAAENFDLFDLKGILQSALRADLNFRRVEPTEFAPLIAEVIGAEGRTIGRIGQLRPGLGKEIGARSAVVVAEIAAESSVVSSFRYKPLDRFPGTSRDVAFVAPLTLKYQEVLEMLRSAGEPLLVDIQLFDLFIDPSGEKVASDKKSMACSLTYRSTERTLTHDEVSAAHDRLKSRLVKQFGVALRE
jgi:phenylalanyl-tRNA synthetase beta chain